jgi:hypothetical protein
VIHCLPGPLSRKAAAVANVAAVLAPSGVLFGASILGPSGPHTWLARKVLDANNRRAPSTTRTTRRRAWARSWGRRSSTWSSRRSARWRSLRPRSRAHRHRLIRPCILSGVDPSRSVEVRRSIDGKYLAAASLPGPYPWPEAAAWA